jgi:hypothetical protein
MRRQRHLSPGSRPGFPEIVSAPLLVVSPTAERNAGLFTKALPVGSRKCCRPRESTAEGNLGNPGVTAASDEHSSGCIKSAIQNPLSRGAGEVPLKPQLDCPRLQATFAFRITHGDRAGSANVTTGSRFAQGEELIAWQDVTIAGGTASINENISGAGVIVTDWITATATLLDGGLPAETSQFSFGIRVTA